MSPVLAALFTIGLVSLLLAFIYTAVHALAYALESAPAWWARNIIADDPNPEYSHMDKRDGLYTTHASCRGYHEAERRQREAVRHAERYGYDVTIPPNSIEGINP